MAVSQLHSGSVNHNDIKPANALVFTSGGQKIADLGRATTPLFSAAHDKQQCVGDRRFAPPEQLYALDAAVPVTERFEFQKAGDLYNLGSLAHYLLTGVSVTQEVVTRLRPELRPPSSAGGWTDKLSLVLPYWDAVLGELLQECRTLSDDFESGEVKREIAFVEGMIGELCEPTWRRRGDKTKAGKPSQYDLARYIARLDLSRTRLLIASKNAK